MALLLRLAALGHGCGYNFTIALVILSIVSMTLGNLVAIVQKDFKRMLAYSSIAHAGVFLIGVLTITEAGYIGAIYYALAYLVMNFTVFMVLSEVATDGRDLKIAELAGLYRRSPLLMHEPDPGDLRPGGRAALHRLHRQTAHLHFRHEFRLFLAGADRRGERHHLPLLLSESDLRRLFHR